MNELLRKIGCWSLRLLHVSPSEKKGGLALQKTPRRGIEPRFTDLKSVVLTVERSRMFNYFAIKSFIYHRNQNCHLSRIIHQHHTPFILSFYYGRGHQKSVESLACFRQVWIRRMGNFSTKAVLNWIDETQGFFEFRIKDFRLNSAKSKDYDLEALFGGNQAKGSKQNQTSLIFGEGYLAIAVVIAVLQPLSTLRRVRQSLSYSRYHFYVRFVASAAFRNSCSKHISGTKTQNHRGKSEGPVSKAGIGYR